jgi:trimethylamine--corrinoid protein Co-methyltransferase
MAMPNTNKIRPSLTVLNEDQKHRIHNHALSILSNVGIRVESDKARAILQRAIGSKKNENQIVIIPPDVVEAAIKAAPSNLDIYDRRGKKVMSLPDEARFGLGVTTLYYQDPIENDLHKFNRNHAATCVRLGDRLANFDFVATPGILQDVSADTADIYTSLEMVANTIKPLVILVSKRESLPDVLDLLEHLHGNLSTQPFVLPLMTPITPLIIDEGTSDRMFTAIARGLPFVYVNHGMAGVNTPITPYGSLSMMMAEILAGITLSQLIQEGSRIIAGCLNAFMDMRTMLNFYDSTSYLLNLACAEMMAYYQIPHYGNSGNAVGWGSDIIAAGHQWMNHITACMGNAGMATFVGTVLGSKAFSPALAVYADEVIAQARRMSKGFEVDDHSVLASEIEAVGPAGNFLSSDLTLKYFRGAYFQSSIFPNYTMEDWMSNDRPLAEDYLSQYTMEFIKSSRPGDETKEIIEKGEAYIAVKR